MDRTSRLLRVLIFLALGVNASGVRVRNGYIAGGQDAEPGMAPYQISIQTHPGDHLCGGAILSERWILTAGHCAVGWLAERLRVATGSHNYREPAAIYYVDEIHSHCRYYVPRYHNDLALLHLNSSIVFDEQTQPVSIAAQAPTSPEDQLLFTGWGAKRVWDDPSEQLQMLLPQYSGPDHCVALLQDIPDVVLAVSHLCTYIANGIGACNGDNGGPLVMNNTLVGIQVWSYMCARGKPDIYANVVYYRDWIRRVLSGHKRCNQAQSTVNALP